jgi:hypothetical protein
MSHTYLVLIALINTAVCFGVGLVCLCRIKAMDKGTRASFRTAYPLLMAGTFASAVQSITPPLYSWPSPADLAVNGAILVWLLSGGKSWANGPPDYASKPMPLDELRHVAGGKGGS